MITPAECREARRLLEWTQRELGSRLGVSQPAISEFERGERLPWVIDQTQLRYVFEAARIEFTNGLAEGVRLKRPGSHRVHKI
jgi:transcriptional regulator with XRE-family HTH domain